MPWSIWAALGLSRLAGRLARRGWCPPRLRRAAFAGFAALGLAYGLGPWLLGPWLDRRGVEWAFYESAGRLVPPGAPVTFLYDDWDRNPYESPFGAFPHDLGVRLFYLGGRRRWCSPRVPGAGLAGRSRLAGLRTALHDLTSSAATATGRRSSGWAASRCSRTGRRCASTGRTRCSGSPGAAGPEAGDVAAVARRPSRR